MNSKETKLTKFISIIENIKKEYCFNYGNDTNGLITGIERRIKYFTWKNLLSILSSYIKFEKKLDPLHDYMYSECFIYNIAKIKNNLYRIEFFVSGYAAASEGKYYSTNTHHYDIKCDLFDSWFNTLLTTENLLKIKTQELEMKKKWDKINKKENVEIGYSLSYIYLEQLQN